MMTRTMALMAATAAMTVASVAQAAPQRTPAPVSAESEELFGSPILTILLVAALVGLGIILLDGDDVPVSP